MEIINQPQKIRIQCPQHQTVFEAENKPHIVCEIREHTLSSNFPNGEVWEYCCDCRTFLPSEFGTGGKAQENCRNCERKTITRYLCENCKIVSYDSAEDTKGKVNHISLQKGIEPTCPGCHSITADSKIIQHDCKDIEKVILTRREKCLFCEKSTAPTLPKPVNSQVVPSTSFIPVKTPSQVKAICSGCGTIYPEDGEFCIECGQKREMSDSVNNPINVLPPPPPIPGQVSSDSTEFDTVFTPAIPKIDNPTKPKNKQMPVIMGIVGCVVLLFIIIGVVKSSKSNSDSEYSNINTSEYSPNSSDLSNSYANDSNMDSYDSNSNMGSSSLPTYFEKTYRGNISGKSFSMTLKREGDELSGTASTYKSDTVSGKISDYGDFELDGYEDGYTLTGKYKGSINSEGTITGNWTTPSGNKSTPFNLKEE